eukprot:5815826-Amphidinium_carterae.2
MLSRLMLLQCSFSCHSQEANSDSHFPDAPALLKRMCLSRKKYFMESKAKEFWRNRIVENLKTV